MPAGTNTSAHEPITQEQRQRLTKIASRVGRTNAEMAVWLQQRFGYASSKAIKRHEYDAVVAAVEHPGPLPLRMDGGA